MLCMYHFTNPDPKVYIKRFPKESSRHAMYPGGVVIKISEEVLTGTGQQ